MRRFIVSCLLGLALASQPAFALTDEEVFRDFRFNLINPGARSLAMGGAFIPLADDATAAQANPAGLPFLVTSEYFAELRFIDNAAQSSIRSETLPAGIETFVATGTDMDDVVSPSFLSAVTTYGTNRHWTMGLSRQEVLNIQNATVSSFAFTFPDSPGAFLAAGTGSIDVSVTNYNVTLGFRPTTRLGLGGTLTYSRLEVNSEVVNMVVDTGGNLAGEELLEPTLDLRTTIDDSDDDVTYSLGLIYKGINKKGQNRWSAGAVYRRGPSFSVLQNIDPGIDVDGDGTIDEGIDLFEVRERLGTSFSNRFSLPDLFGIGASWLPIADKLTLSLEIDRVLYSNLMDDYVSGVNILTSSDAQFTIEDATDYRLGAEYLLLIKESKLKALAFRGGAYTEEPAAIQAESTGSQSFATEEVFQTRDRVDHFTLGVGFAFKRYKIDYAMDFSDPSNTYLLSFIYQGK